MEGDGDSRIRRKGGGRESSIELNENLARRLEEIIIPHAMGILSGRCSGQVKVYAIYGLI